MRSARCSGCRRSRSIRSARPTTIAGLRAAEQLVAAEADEVGAGGERCARGRLVGDLDERARAEVVEQRHAVLAGDGGQLGERRALGEADDAEVRLVDAQQQRRLRTGSVAVVGGAAFGSSSRPRRGVAPERASTSGMRKPSPISISSPRETSTSRPSASAASASSIAAALLLTTIAASAPGQPAQDRGHVILARAARAVDQVVLEIRVALGDLRAPGRRAAAESGARPRLVCTITPVAFRTRRRAGRCAAARRSLQARR